jgi:hypothetical protein
MRVPLRELRQAVELTVHDPDESERVWDPMAIAESISQFAKLKGQSYGYIYVDRDRKLKESRRETQGILSGGESRKVPEELITLFLLRTKPEAGMNAAWWPQIRFPLGRYGFAFSI